MELFAGTMGTYKNPQSHRDVNLGDPAEAVEIIMLTNQLLRIVDKRYNHARRDDSRCKPHGLAVRDHAGL